MLRDLLVVGVDDDRIRRRLLSERRLKFPEAREIALAMESADRNVKDIAAHTPTDTPSQQGLNWVKRPTEHIKTKRLKPCYRCNGRHSPDYCRYKEALCNFCHKAGHISPACLTRKHKEKAGNQNQKTHKVGQEVPVGETCSIADSNTGLSHSLFKLQGSCRIDPLLVLVGINGRHVEMEVDTGAAVSLISQTAFNNLWSRSDKPQLKPTAQKLSTYTGENIIPCGICRVSVDYDSRNFHLPLMVIPEYGPTLLGRNWLQVIQFNWKHLHQLKAVNATPVVEDILAKYPDVFKDELGTLKGFTAKLSVDPKTKPIFCKS